MRVRACLYVCKLTRAIESMWVRRLASVSQQFALNKEPLFSPWVESQQIQKNDP